MTAADLEFYQAFLSAFGLAALSATVAWWRARKRAVRAEAKVAELRGELRGELRAELRAESRAEWAAAPEQAGLQSAVEAIAIEVERIGEGQRFLTRMKREPAPRAAAPLPSPVRDDTPR
jgi:hypothetical protein